MTERRLRRALAWILAFAALALLDLAAWIHPEAYTVEVRR